LPAIEIGQKAKVGNKNRRCWKIELFFLCQ